MPIDVTKPVDGVPSVKGELRANLQATDDAIKTGISTNSSTAITINAASFNGGTGVPDRQFIKILCTFAGTVTPTFAGDVPAGKLVEFVAEGATTVMSATPAVSGSATLVKPTSGVHATTQRYEATVYEVDTNSGTNARWRLVARP